MHRSVLSLTSSHEVGYYDELARNLDANLAEVEMEDFQSQDIHSILSTLHNDLQVCVCIYLSNYSFCVEILVLSYCTFKTTFDKLSWSPAIQKEHGAKVCECVSVALAVWQVGNIGCSDLRIVGNWPTQPQYLLYQKIK